MTSQPDLFAGVETAPPPPAPEARAAKMSIAARTRLTALLGELRGAETNPWTRQRTEVHQILFRQMSNWLPAEERERLGNEFRAELGRLSIPAYGGD
jgi:hypothetical protein